MLRGVQAIGGAALLVGAFPLLDAGGAGRRAWTATAIFGFAAGPALGGALTQAFDWRAIFLVQVPLAAAAALAVAAWTRRPRGVRPRRRAQGGGQTPFAVGGGAVGPRSGWRWRCSRRRSSGVLFLLVLLLVTGWSVSPLAAAARGDACCRSPRSLAARVRGPAGRGPPRARCWSRAGCCRPRRRARRLAVVDRSRRRSWPAPGSGSRCPALAGELLPEDTAEQAASAARDPARRHHRRADPARARRGRPARRRGRRHAHRGRRAGARRGAPAAREAQPRRRAGGRPRSRRPARPARAVARPRAPIDARTAPPTTSSRPAPTRRWWRACRRRSRPRC